MSSEKLVFLRQVNSQLSKLVDSLFLLIKPGMRDLDIEKVCASFFRNNKLKSASLNYKGFPSEVCVSVNEEVCHGIPNGRILEEGDIVSVDIAAVGEHGYYGDTCFSYAVGKIDKKKQKLLKVAYEAMWSTIEKIRAGIRTGDLGFSMQNYAETRGFSVIKVYAGHGIGKNFHEDPSIPFFGIVNKGPRIEEGTSITIEPMIIDGSDKVFLKQDRWTCVGSGLSAQFEHSIFVMKDGFEVLSYNSFDKKNNKPITKDQLK